jgi:hypothetical protein
MGCGEAVEKLSPEEDSCTSIKEDCRVLAYRHVPPCGKGSTNPAGSGAPGLRTGPTPLRCHPRKALPAEAGGEGSGGRRRRILGGRGGLVHYGLPLSPSPHWPGHLQPCAGSERRRWRRERRLPPWVEGGGEAGGRSGRSGRRFRQAGRRGLDEDRARLCWEKGIQSPLSMPGGPREREREVGLVRTAGLDRQRERIRG